MTSDCNDDNNKSWLERHDHGEIIVTRMLLMQTHKKMMMKKIFV